MSGLDQDAIDAVAIRVVGQKTWDQVNVIGHFQIRGQILGVLNAAMAEGWTPPASDDPRPVTDDMVTRALAEWHRVVVRIGSGTPDQDAMRAALEAAAMTPSVGVVMAYDLGHDDGKAGAE